MLIVRWPWGSRSMRRTRLPSSASAHPRFTAVVVLPTPPFWLATAMTLLKRWLDLCAGTWLRLFNGNTAAQSSSDLWISSRAQLSVEGGASSPSTRRRDLEQPRSHALGSVATVDPARQARSVERDRPQEPWHLTRVRRRLEARSELDQRRFTEGRR